MRNRVTFNLFLPRHSARCVVAALALLSGGMVTPADAQLGKLKKIGADAIKDAAKEKAGVKEPEKAAGSRDARVDYAISEERLTAVVSFLTPQVAEAEKRAELRTVMRDYDTKQKAATECFTNATKGDVMPDIEAATSPRAEALTKKSSAYQTKQIEASKAKNYRGMVAFMDSSTVTQMQLASITFSATKCPPMPFKPVALIDAEASAMERGAAGKGVEESSGAGTVPASLRVGMTTGQFGRIRERVAIWVLMRRGDLPPDTEKFTDDEVAFLTAHADALMRLGAVFKTGALRWATWEDITTW